MPEPQLSTVARTDLIRVVCGGVESLAAVGLVTAAADTFPGATSGSTTIAASAVASGTLTLPAATDTLVGRATTDTLANKTLTSPVINGLVTGTSQACGRLAAPVTTTSNVQANDALTGLSFAIGASEVWVVDFYLTCTGTTGGMKFQLTGPTPTDIRISTVGNTTGVGVTSFDTQTAVATPGAAWIVNATPFTGFVHVHASINNGVTAGTIALTFASTTNTQSNSVLANSYMVAQRLA